MAVRWVEEGEESRVLTPCEDLIPHEEEEEEEEEGRERGGPSSSSLYTMHIPEDSRERERERASVSAEVTIAGAGGEEVLGHKFSHFS